MISYTEQEAFDKSISGLRDQNKKSYTDRSERTCAYRGSNGCKCAIGHLIPDNIYSAKMEKKSISILLDYNKYNIDKLFKKMDFSFLQQLQAVHDWYSVKEWPEQAFKFAKRFGLKYKHLISVVHAFGQTYYSWIK